MHFVKKSILLATFIGLLMIISACSTKYVCFDGSVEKNSAKCPVYPIPAKTEREAKLSVDSFGSAYAQAKKDRYTFVNIFTSSSNWFADVLFTSTETGEVHSVRLIVDGKTGSVDCYSGCSYLGLEDKSDAT